MREFPCLSQHTQFFLKFSRTVKAFRIIRITRVLKTVQVVRVFRFVMALRTLVTSIFHTLKALFWALILLFLIVYVFSVIFTSAVNEALNDPTFLPRVPERDAQARRYFSSLWETMLSLFMAIAGGVSWEEVIAPLRYVSEIWGLAYLVFFSFTYFAVLNVVTAVFCSTAIESAKNDHATVVQSMLLNHSWKSFGFPLPRLRVQQLLISSRRALAAQVGQQGGSLGQAAGSIQLAWSSRDRCHHLHDV